MLDAVDRFTRLVAAQLSSHVFVTVSVVTFLCAGLVTFVLSLRRTGATSSLAGLIGHCFPGAKWASASTKVDVLLYVLSKFSQKWIVLLSTFVVVLLASAAASRLGGPAGQAEKLTAGPVTILAISLLMWVFADLGSFLSHLVQHRVPALWEFHKIHHSATFLTPFTTYRFHPVGNLLDGLFIGTCLALPVAGAQLLYGFTFVQLVAMSAGTELVLSLALMGALQHSHFQISFGILDRVFISPQMHQVHHSVKREHWGKNLGGKLSIWDWCLGTGIMLPKGEVLTFGMGTVEDERGDYKSVLWCYVGPVVNCWRMARRTFSRRPPSAESADEAAAV